MKGIGFSAVAALLLALSACATRPAPGYGIEPDESVRVAVAATARAVAGREVEVVVHVGHAVRAELRTDGSLHVWRGLLLRTADANELAFALAHELAHDELAHPFPVRGEARVVDHELAADARAREDLLRRGFDAEAGVKLLRALRAEAATMGADANAMAELDRRIAAWPADAAGYGVRSDDAWRATWRAHHEQWLAADPASADPKRLGVVKRNADEALRDR